MDAVTARQRARDPIAIVGIGCRFPGAPDLDAFWSVLRDGTDAIGTYPGGRLPLIDAVFAGRHPLSADLATNAGGFLPGVDLFDPEFFGISAREAALVDPQHRLLLETAWEAVEDAGLVREQLAGSRTGVFVGLWTSDYETCLRQGRPDLEFHATIGSGRYSAAGRLSYIFDVRGPSLTVDTACSSSLVALHLAMQSLAAGEIDMALVAGSNVILRPDVSLIYGRSGMLSPAGRCRFGDAAADGYVRSEGAATIVLRPLSAALASGDPVHAIVAGSAVNNDGQSSGLLVSPSRAGQADVLRAACRDAGIAPAALDYIEAHGTGTLVGDPVELEAIGQVMVEDGGRKRPVLVGSVKSNIGHTESAAGLAGVIKIALALRHEVIPASLHFETPNPRVPWDRLPVAVPREATPWPEDDRPRYAGVTGLGITGTNAHVVLQGAPAEANAAATPRRAGTHVLALSAHTGPALDALVRAWERRLREDPGSSMHDLCYTAARRRTHQAHRLAVTAKGAGDAAEKLALRIAGEDVDGLVAGRVRDVTEWKIAFVFSGAGGQWPGMGVALHRDEPAFREALEACDAAVRRQGGPSVIEEMARRPEENRFGEFEILQPTLWAMQVALAALWRSWGVEPGAVVAHSMGEIAAAVAAGALSLDDGAAVIWQRALVTRSVVGKGLMAVTGLTASEAEEFVRPYDGRLSVAALNGSASTVLSGDPDAIADALRRLEAREVFCRQVKVNVASHSAHMDPIRGEFEAALSSVTARPGRVPVYSTTTGAIEDGTNLGAAHWGRNLRQPVLFWPQVQRLIADGFNAFVEIGPHPVLLHSIAETIRESGVEAVAIASTHRDTDEQADLRASWSALHIAGVPVDFSTLYPSGRVVPLPTYPWQRERHWIDSSAYVADDVLPAAAARDAGEHVYEQHWKLGVDAAPGSAGPRRVLLVAADGDASGRTVGTALERAGHTVTSIHGDAPGELGRALAQETAASDVVYVCADRGAVAGGDAAAVQRGVTAEIERVIATVRELARPEVTTPRLWLVTAGACAFGTDPAAVRLGQSAMTGLAGAIRREHPELRCCQVDLGPGSDGDAGSLAELVAAGTAESLVAIRDGRRWARRYERAAGLPSVAAAGFDPAATFLVTGGMGGIGLSVAGWLVEHGARHVALVGRRGPGAAALAEIERLRGLGADVRVLGADVADAAQVDALFATLDASMPPLGGVFHAAGVVGDVLLRDASDDGDRIERVLAPKVAGALNLHRATAGRPLSAFVLFSSIAVALPQPGQGIYAAANAFEDGLAAWRRAQGLPAAAIEWGVWSDTGVARGEGAKRNEADYTEHGVRSWTCDEGLAALGHAMNITTPCAIVAPVDWARFAASRAADDGTAEFAGLLPAPAAPAAEGATEDTARDRILAAAPHERGGLVEAHVREQLARVLKTAAARIDPRRPLGALGLDSLLSLELVRRLSQSFGIKVPATIVFNHPTLSALSAEVGRRLGIADPAPALAVPSGEAALAAPPGAVAELSDDDAILALMAKRRIQP